MSFSKYPFSENMFVNLLRVCHICITKITSLHLAEPLLAMLASSETFRVPRSVINMFGEILRGLVSRSFKMFPPGEMLQFDYVAFF